MKEITIAIATIALTDLAEKGADIDVLRQMAQFIAQCLMEIHVDEAMRRALRPEISRKPDSQNGCCNRAWDTRAGSVALKIPKLSALMAGGRERRARVHVRFPWRNERRSTQPRQNGDF